jgi:single-stranded-DNA-specific exonuclease
MDGDHGKASSRSYGGFNLFSALTQLSPLLESYGGHELAAGFTIHRQQIPAFRQEISAMAKQYYAQGAPRTVLEADCEVGPELLTVNNVESLQMLEPCGNGCPKPLLVMEGLQIERLSSVGNGRHLRLRLQKGRHALNAIYFSATPQSAAVCPGDLVDVAFVPQINEFRGEKSVQLNIQDIRPHCQAQCSAEAGDYYALTAGSLTPAAAAKLLPDRATLAAVWRYITCVPQQELNQTPMCLLRKIVRWSGLPMSLGKLLTCLDIFADVGLLELRQCRKYIILNPATVEGKADLSQSPTMQRLMAVKES